MIFVRKAVSKDYHELMILYNAFIGQDRYSKHNNDSFARVLANPNNFVYVAEDNEKPVGFATFTKRDVIRYPKPIAELDELYVAEEYRKKGVGKMLMDEVVSEAKRHNCHRLFIESNYNHKAGHAFYEALGFTNYGYHFIKDL